MNDKEEITEKVDIFSAGLVILAIFTNTTSPKESRLPEVIKMVPNSLQSLLQRMLAHRPADRPSALEALSLLQSIDLKFQNLMDQKKGNK